MTDAFVEKIADLASWVGIGVGVAAWWFAREDATRKGAELDRYKAESEKEVAALKTTAEQLKKETAEARLKTAEIQALVEWRTISPERLAKLQKALPATPVRVRLAWIAGDSEALHFATVISKAFPGWNLFTGSRVYEDALPAGLTIVGKSDSGVASVRKAFEAAEVPFSTIPFMFKYLEYGHRSPPAEDAVVEIIVGCKPQPDMPLPPGK